MTSIDDQDPESSAAPSQTDAAPDGSHAAAALAAAAAGAGSGNTQEQQARSAAKRSRRKSTIEQTLPFVAGVLLSVALQLIIANTVAPETYLYRLFRPPGGWVMSLVPGLIVFVLIWTMADLALKYREGRLNEKDLERREIRQLPRTVAQEPTDGTIRRLLQLDGRERPVVRRLLWLLHYLEHNDDAQRTHELLRHQSDLDADTTAAGYRTSKLFIWAMPILGFVGTVLGISLAVGGFSQFLTSNLDIEDVSKVTSELGNVASGLSFAFDTTLLGLLAGLVANVFSSIVQKRDERFFTRLDELGLGIVANREGISTTAAVPNTDRIAVDPNYEAVMQAQIDEISGIVERTRNVMQGLTETSARMNTGLSESMSSMSKTVEELGHNMAGVSEAMAAGNASQESVEQAVARLSDAIGSFGTGVSEAMAAGNASQEAVEQAVVHLSDAIGSFGEGLAELRKEQSTLGPVLEQLAGPLELRLVPGQRPTSEGNSD